MSQILVVGDGPLAKEFYALVKASDHVVHYVGWQHFDSAPEIDSYDFLVEALINSVDHKQAALRELVPQMKHDAVILTATLNSSVAQVATWLPGNTPLVGWAALPPLRDLIEIVPYHVEASETAASLFESLGKQAVSVADSPGGVLPRIIASLINNAAYALYEQVATAEDIDRAMQMGTNYPLGPLAWADKIGVEQVVGILNTLSAAFGSHMYHPCPLLQQRCFSNRPLVNSQLI